MQKIVFSIVHLTSSTLSHSTFMVNILILKFEMKFVKTRAENILPVAGGPAALVLLEILLGPVVILCRPTYTHKLFDKITKRKKEKCCLVETCITPITTIFNADVNNGDIGGCLYSTLITISYSENWHGVLMQQKQYNKMEKQFPSESNDIIYQIASPKSYRNIEKHKRTRSHVDRTFYSLTETNPLLFYSFSHLLAKIEKVNMKEEKEIINKQRNTQYPVDIPFYFSSNEWHIPLLELLLALYYLVYFMYINYPSNFLGMDPQEANPILQHHVR
ncbi:hypothetical protein ACJX0J_009584, partial [Zea mays]